MALEIRIKYCKSRIFCRHVIFVYFVRGGFRTKIKCIRKVQSKSETIRSGQRLYENFMRTKGRRAQDTKIECVRNILDLQYSIFFWPKVRSCVRKRQALAVHGALIARVYVFAKKKKKKKKKSSLCNELGPSLPPALVQLPREPFSALHRQSSDHPNLAPLKNFFKISISFHHCSESAL